MSHAWSPAKNALRDEVGEAAADELGPATMALASRLREREGGWVPLVQPIYHSSTYTHASVQSYLENIKKEGYIYQRLSNPTCEALEVVINELEGGKGSLVYASGLDAITAVFLTFLKAGDHLICQRPCYSGTSEFIMDTLEKFAVEVSWAPVDGGREAWASLIKPNTRMIYAETPSNPTLSVVDLDMIGSLGTKDILTVVDATFASPYVIQPIKHGVNFAVHSCTKYMGGHSDLIAGCVTVDNVEHWKDLKVHTAGSGGSLAPGEAALLHRGVKTLPLRMERHSLVATEIARFLQDHPKVVRVFYPGLPSHPQYALAQAQMRVPGGMMAFELRTLAEAMKLTENLKLISLAVSLGGCETLITVPTATTHGPMLMSDKERKENHIAPGLLRFSGGLEDPKDLINDLKQALEHV